MARIQAVNLLLRFACSFLLVIQGTVALNKR